MTGLRNAMSDLMPPKKFPMTNAVRQMDIATHTAIELIKSQRARIDTLISTGIAAQLEIDRLNTQVDKLYGHLGKQTWDNMIATHDTPSYVRKG